MIVKVIDHHFTELIENKEEFPNLDFGLISNDNGFLTYTPNHFSQRTLTGNFFILTLTRPLRKNCESALTHRQLGKKETYLNKMM